MVVVIVSELRKRRWLDLLTGTVWSFHGYAIKGTFGVAEVGPVWQSHAAGPGYPDYLLGARRAGGPPAWFGPFVLGDDFRQREGWSRFEWNHIGLGTNKVHCSARPAVRE